MESQLKRIRVHYDDFGEGTPVLFIHGSPLDNHETIFEMEPHFAERSGWRRLYIDLPGCGKTPGPDWITSWDQVLDVLEEFIDIMLPDQRLVIAGSSSGAYLARALVYRRAKQLDGLFLNIPVIINEQGKRQQRPARTVLGRDDAVAGEATAKGYRWLDAVAVVQNRATLDYARALSESVVDTAFLDRTRSTFAFERDRLPRPFPAPTLIITGRQDHVAGYRDVWSILDDFPRATFAVLDRSGHMVIKEQQQICSALVSEWLDRVVQWRSEPSSATASLPGRSRRSEQDS